MIHQMLPPKQELLPHIAFPSERFFSSFTAQSMLFRRGKNVRGLRLSLLGKGHSRRGRCLHRPVGYVSRAVRKNGHAHTIGPRGAAPERSEKTDTPIPLASGPMWASAPTKNNVRFQRRGRCPHRPVGCVSGAVRKNGHACTASRGPMWASAPTRLIIPDREKCAEQSEADEADFFRGRNYPFISVFWASRVSAAVRGRRTL